MKLWKLVLENAAGELLLINLMLDVPAEIPPIRSVRIGKILIQRVSTAKHE